jgi:NAD(P)-dependent dehydrogenase (short-subunit alcohol dehydrogenase family)
MTQAAVRLDERVVVITGAGRGLGRAHALQCASIGALVVVNDVDADPAHEVVDEIRAAGGEAVAVAARVDAPAEAASIVEAAQREFGRVDALVNNAGILRDAMFHKMTDEEWRAIVDVHLHGAWHVTRAAWPRLRESGSGRVVFTTSHAGLLGNAGQANYAAAKLGLVGLANALAAEGVRRGVRVNVVAPLAASRLSSGIDKLAPLADLDPAPVASLVAFLCSEACPDTGMIIGAAGGTFVRYAIAEGEPVRLGPDVSPDDVAASWARVSDLSAPRLPTDASFRSLLGG